MKHVTFQRKDDLVLVVRSVGDVVVRYGDLILTNGATVSVKALAEIRTQNPDVEFVQVKR